MIKIYQLNPQKKVFESVYGDFFIEKYGKKIRTLDGYLWLLEKVIEDFSYDNPDKKREIIFNSVFKYLDTKVSDWIERIYEKGGEVGEKKLEKYMKIADRLEEITNAMPGDFNKFNKLRKRKIRDKKREMGGYTALTKKEALAKYEEAMRVPVMSLAQLAYYSQGVFAV